MAFQPKNFTRPAIGRGGSLGLLYDASSDCVIYSQSILKGEAPLEAIEVTETPNIKHEITTEDSLHEKLSKLDVSGELSASLMGGLFELSGSGKYLSNQKSTAKVESSSVICNIKTKHERLILGSDALRGVLDLDTLAHGDATHVITGIHWGGNCIVTAEASLDDSVDSTDAGGSANISGKWAEVMIKVSGKGEMESNDQNTKHSFKFTTTADIAVDFAMPEDFKQAAEFIKKIPEDLREPNKGKGVPIQYDLTSLPTLAKRFEAGTTVREESMIATLREDCLAQFVDLFHRINTVKQDVNAYLDDVMAHPKCVPGSQVAKARKTFSDIRNMEIELKREFQRALLKLRQAKAESGSSDAHGELFNLLARYSNRDGVGREIYSSILYEYRDKMDMADWFSKKGVNYVTDAPRNLERFVMFEGGDQFVLYFNELTRAGENWDKTYTLFHELVVNRAAVCEEAADGNAADGKAAGGKAGDGKVAGDGKAGDQEKKTYKVAVVDCDVGYVANAGPRKLAKAFIEKRRDGKIIVADVVADMQALAGKSLLRCQDPTQLETSRAILAPPPGRRVVRVFCPGEHCFNSERSEWVCPDCREAVCFGHGLAAGGWDDSLYCGCGRYPVSQGQFKCGNPVHGAGYYSFADPDHLAGLLRNLDLSDECSVMILSEKGVDKPTLISSLWNYLLFGSLDEALNSRGPLKVATHSPRAFSHEGQTVLGGEDISASSPRKIKYDLAVKNRTVRLFDVADIDTAVGSAQAPRVLNEILSVLRSVDRLDAVLFILPPDAASLSDEFKLYMTNVISQLQLGNNKLDSHLMFGFASSGKAGQFALGDTKMPLNSILQTAGIQISLGQGNTFFFDQEGFGFPALHRTAAPSTQSIDRSEGLNDRWTASAINARRLIQEVTRLAPLNIRESLCLERTRRFIADMKGPMAKHVLLTATAAESRLAEQEKLGNVEAEMKELDKELAAMKDGGDARTKLPKPKTVCCFPGCAVFKDGASPGEKVRASCCSACTVDPVEDGKEGSSRLRYCWAFYDRQKETYLDDCVICGHGRKLHMHACYDKNIARRDNSDVTKEKDDLEEERRAILRRTSDNETLEKEFAKEAETVENALVCFGVYLKDWVPNVKDMIAALKDAISGGLERLVCDAATNEGERVKRLRELQKSYDDRLERVADRIEAGRPSAESHHGEIEDVMAKLYETTHLGLELKKATSTSSGHVAASENANPPASDSTVTAASPGGDASAGNDVPPESRVQAAVSQDSAAAAPTEEGLSSPWESVPMLTP